jgi:hypothetical protein
METATTTTKLNGHKSDQAQMGLIDHQCENPKCGKHFFTSNKAKKYCSNKCRVAAQRVQLSGLPDRGDSQVQVESSKVPARPISDIKTLSFPHFPEAAQYIIHDLNEKKSKLETELQKLKDDYDDLQDEYFDLEKSLEATKNALDKKPGALAGLFNEPDKLLGIIQNLPEALRGLKDTFKELVPQQLAGTQEQQQQQQQNDVLAWLGGKPLEVQRKFIVMLDGFSRMQDGDLNNWVDFMNLKIPKAS